MTKLVYGKNAVYVEDAKSAVEAVRPELVKIMKGFGYMVPKIDLKALRDNLNSNYKEYEQGPLDSTQTIELLDLIDSLKKELSAKNALLEDAVAMAGYYSDAKCVFGTGSHSTDRIDDDGQVAREFLSRFHRV